jgi:hypothetical protein
MRIRAAELTLVVILLINFTVILARAAPSQPHNADAMWVEPASLSFNTNTTSVGFKFNVTVAMNFTEDVFAWQGVIYYNATQLNCTRVGATAPPTSEFMTGFGTTFSKAISPGSYPPIGDLKSVLASETCSAPDFIPGPQSGTLFWAEFQIKLAPSSGTFNSKFDISREYALTNTYVWDPTGNPYAFAPIDGNYQFTNSSGPPPPPPPLSVSISPLSTTIHVGQTVHFTSTVSGGIAPYSFQWFLNGASVPGATSNNWNFTPAAIESDNVYLTVTDNNGTTKNSTNASVTVTAPPGGTRIYVEPPEIINLTMGPSSTFDINVTLGNATDVGQCTFNLTYVPSVINWIGIEVFRVQGQFPIATLMLNGKAGFVWVSLNYSSPINTDPPAPIVRMSFHVEAYGISPLNLTDTQLLDSGGQPISHDEFDGLFSNIIRDVAVINVVPATNWIYQGWSDDINVTVKNLGNVSETFTASAYYNSSLIGIVPIVNLAPNAETTATITWNTAGVLEGNYTITGVASIVPYESNTANNIYIDGIVQVVTIIHDVAITDVTPANSWVYHGNLLKINVTAANLGNVSESFNVTAYADNDTIGMFPVVNLASNAQITITFVWNTTSSQTCHNYTISGVASPLPHEYNATNNVYIDGAVKVRLYGDVNDDGRVDGKDVALASLAFGTIPGNARWNPDADINQDGRIDGKDIVLISLNFGKSCP